MAWKMNEFHFHKRKYVSLLIFSLALLITCNPLDLRKDCDPSSPDYLRNSFIVQFFQLRPSGCYPPYVSSILASKRRASMWGFFSLNAGNGGVREVSVSGNRAYVAGMFDYVGPNTGSLAMLDGTNQNLLSEENCPYFEIDGSINQIIDDGNGNAIIAGTFNYVQGVKRRAIAKIKPDCTLDSSFNANLADPTAEVRSILIHNGKLFIAGLFSGTFATTGNDTRTNVAVINAATGVIDPSWDANMLGSEVNVIKTDGTNLFLGGSFYQIGALSVNNLAKVDMTSGTVV